MKKKDVFVLETGSAAQVLAHGHFKKGRGRMPSMAFRGILNPKKAYAAAKEALDLGAIKDLMTYETIEGITHIYINGDVNAERRVLQAIVLSSFELSRPAGMGWVHFDESKKMTDKEADFFIRLSAERGAVVINMDYVQGRQCKTILFFEEAGHYVLQNRLFERDRGSVEPMLEKAKQLVGGNGNQPGLVSTMFMFSGESLTLRLKEYGFSRLSDKESDWDFRKRIFPDFFEISQERALEFLFGASAAEWNEVDRMLFMILISKGKSSRSELIKFAKGFGCDPAESRKRRTAA